LPFKCASGLAPVLPPFLGVAGIYLDLLKLKQRLDNH